MAIILSKYHYESLSFLSNFLLNLEVFIIFALLATVKKTLSFSFTVSDLFELSGLDH